MLLLCYHGCSWVAVVPVGYLLLLYPNLSEINICVHCMWLEYICKFCIIRFGSQRMWPFISDKSNYRCRIISNKKKNFSAASVRIARSSASLHKNVTIMSTELWYVSVKEQFHCARGDLFLGQKMKLWTAAGLCISFGVDNLKSAKQCKIGNSNLIWCFF